MEIVLNLTATETELCFEALLSVGPTPGEEDAYYTLVVWYSVDDNTRHDYTPEHLRIVLNALLAVNLSHSQEPLRRRLCGIFANAYRQSRGGVK